MPTCPRWGRRSSPWPTATAELAAERRRRTCGRDVGRSRAAVRPLPGTGAKRCARRHGLDAAPGPAHRPRRQHRRRLGRRWHRPAGGIAAAEGDGFRRSYCTRPRPLRRRRQAGVGGTFEAAVGGAVDTLHGEPVHGSRRGEVAARREVDRDRSPARRPARERPGADRRHRPRRRQHAGAELAPHAAVQPGATRRASASIRERCRSSWSRPRSRTRPPTSRSPARSSRWTRPA